jgi:tRNA pseudouridine55 synthase
MYSALKRCGVPLYKLARQGKSVHREPRDLTIFSLNIEKIELPKISFKVRCTRGTYVRTLASDLGDALGCGAHLSDLRRTVSGMFTVDDAISLEQLSRLKEECLLAENISPYRLVTSYGHRAVGQGADRIRVGTIPDLEGFEMYPQGHLPEGENLRCLTKKGSSSG